MRHHRVIGIAAGDHGFYLRVDFVQSPDELFSPHTPGYCKIRDHQVEGHSRFKSVLIESERRLSLRRANDLIPQMLQHLSGDVPHILLIVHHQDFAFPRIGVLLRLFLLHGDAAQGGEIDEKGSARPRLRLQGNVAVMLSDDGISGGETEPASLLLRSEIGVEDLLEMLFRDTDPFVGE